MKPNETTALNRKCDNFEKTDYKRLIWHKKYTKYIPFLMDYNR